MHVLAIANSFGQDALQYLNQIAKADGVEIEAINLMIGGCSLERHAKLLRQIEATPKRLSVDEWSDRFYSLEINGEDTGEYISLKEALQIRNWDVVTFQQASHYSGVEESFEPYLSELLGIVKRTNPEAKCYMHETWAYEVDSEHEGFNTYGRDQGEMYRRLNSAYTRHANTHGLDLIPVGRLIQDLRADRSFNVAKGGISLCRDGFHLDFTYGRYAAGLLWYRKLSGRSVLENSFLPPTTDGETLDLNLIDKIKRAVQSVELNP